VVAASSLGRRLAGVGLGLAFIVALVLATQREAAVECEVCIEFGGREACRTGSGADRDTAIRGAINTACAVLSSGVTRGMQCDRTPPRSVECSEP
jgi:hypothetical protein